MLGELLELQPGSPKRAFAYSLLQVKLAGSIVDTGDRALAGRALALMNESRARVMQLKESDRLPISEAEFTKYLTLLEFHRSQASRLADKLD